MLFRSVSDSSSERGLIRLMNATRNSVGSGVGSGVTVGVAGGSVGVSVAGNGLPLLGPLPHAAARKTTGTTRIAITREMLIDSHALALLLCLVTAMTETSSA